jgi:hypothetical protein
MRTNRERSLHCERALETYEDDDLATNLIDLLTDAMHWCDHTGQDFHIALAQACRHYVNELNDQQHDERRMS